MKAEPDEDMQRTGPVLVAPAATPTAAVPTPLTGECPLRRRHAAAIAHGGTTRTLCSAGIPRHATAASPAAAVARPAHLTAAVTAAATAFAATGASGGAAPLPGQVHQPQRYGPVLAVGGGAGAAVAAAGAARAGGGAGRGWQRILPGGAPAPASAVVAVPASVLPAVTAVPAAKPHHVAIKREPREAAAAGGPAGGELLLPGSDAGAVAAAGAWGCSLRVSEPAGARPTDAAANVSLGWSAAAGPVPRLAPPPARHHAEAPGNGSRPSLAVPLAAPVARRHMPVVKQEPTHADAPVGAVRAAATTAAAAPRQGRLTDLAPPRTFSSDQQQGAQRQRVQDLAGDPKAVAGATAWQQQQQQQEHEQQQLRTRLPPTQLLLLRATAAPQRLRIKLKVRGPGAPPPAAAAVGGAAAPAAGPAVVASASPGPAAPGAVVPTALPRSAAAGTGEHPATGDSAEPTGEGPPARVQRPLRIRLRRRMTAAEPDPLSPLDLPNPPAAAGGAEAGASAGAAATAATTAAKATGVLSAHVEQGREAREGLGGDAAVALRVAESAAAAARGGAGLAAGCTVTGTDTGAAGPGRGGMQGTSSANAARSAGAGAMRSTQVQQGLLGATSPPAQHLQQQPLQQLTQPPPPPSTPLRTNFPECPECPHAAVSAAAEGGAVAPMTAQASPSAAALPRLQPQAREPAAALPLVAAAAKGLRTVAATVSDGSRGTCAPGSETCGGAATAAAFIVAGAVPVVAAGSAKGQDAALGESATAAAVGSILAAAGANAAADAAAANGAASLQERVRQPAEGLVEEPREGATAPAGSEERVPPPQFGEALPLAAADPAEVAVPTGLPPSTAAEREQARAVEEEAACLSAAAVPGLTSAGTTHIAIQATAGGAADASCSAAGGASCGGGAAGCVGAVCWSADRLAALEAPDPLATARAAQAAAPSTAPPAAEGNLGAVAPVPASSAAAAAPPASPRQRRSGLFAGWLLGRWLSGGSPGPVPPATPAVAPGAAVRAAAPGPAAAIAARSRTDAGAGQRRRNGSDRGPTGREGSPTRAGGVLMAVSCAAAAVCRRVLPRWSLGARLRLEEERLAAAAGGVATGGGPGVDAEEATQAAEPREAPPAPEVARITAHPDAMLCGGQGPLGGGTGRRAGEAAASGGAGCPAAAAEVPRTRPRTRAAAAAATVVAVAQQATGTVSEVAKPPSRWRATAAASAKAAPALAQPPAGASCAQAGPSPEAPAARARRRRRSAAGDDGDAAGVQQQKQVRLGRPPKQTRLLQLIAPLAPETTAPAQAADEQGDGSMAPPPLPPSPQPAATAAAPQRPPRGRPAAAAFATEASTNTSRLAHQHQHQAPGLQGAAGSAECRVPLSAACLTHPCISLSQVLVTQLLGGHTAAQQRCGARHSLPVCVPCSAPAPAPSSGTGTFHAAAAAAERDTDGGRPTHGNAIGGAAGGAAGGVAAGGVVSCLMEIGTLRGYEAANSGGSSTGWRLLNLRSWLRQAGAVAGAHELSLSLVAYRLPPPSPPAAAAVATATGGGTAAPCTAGVDGQAGPSAGIGGGGVAAACGLGRSMQGGDGIAEQKGAEAPLSGPAVLVRLVSARQQAVARPHTSSGATDTEVQRASGQEATAPCGEAGGGGGRVAEPADGRSASGARVDAVTAAGPVTHCDAPPGEDADTHRGVGRQQRVVSMSPLQRAPPAVGVGVGVSGKRTRQQVVVAGASAAAPRGDWGVTADTRSAERSKRRRT